VDEPKRSSASLYHGTSPGHSRTVALVLNLCTGLASSPFLVTLDDLFESVGKESGNPQNAFFILDSTSFVCFADCAL
jgi:hypothetical protein